MNFRQNLKKHLDAIQGRNLQDLEAHRGWFAMDNWSHGTEEVAIYREPPSVRRESYLTLVFERRDGQWLMVQDQNTPIK